MARAQGTHGKRRFYIPYQNKSFRNKLRDLIEKLTQQIRCHFSWFLGNETLFNQHIYFVYLKTEKPDLKEEKKTIWPKHSFICAFLTKIKKHSWKLTIV